MVKRVTIATTVAAAMLAFLAGPGAGTAWGDFVCPVLPGSTEVQQKRDQTPAPFIPISGGDQSILPGTAGDVLPADVPSGATNADGAGSPGGAHAEPGDSDYTAIWDS